MIKVAMVWAVVMAFIASAGAASAGEITGDIQFTGEVAVLGGNGSASGATGLSFVQYTNGGSSSAGTAEIVGTTADFSTLFNQGDDCSSFTKGGCGQIRDVPVGTLSVHYGPVTGMLSFTLDGVTVTFNLSDITEIIREGNANSSYLGIFGVGIISAPGYAPTNGDFSLSVQGDNADDSFSGEIEFVPEPASIMIFGSALIGLGIVRRHRPRSTT